MLRKILELKSKWFSRCAKLCIDTNALKRCISNIIKTGIKTHNIYSEIHPHKQTTKNWLAADICRKEGIWKKNKILSH